MAVSRSENMARIRSRDTEPELIVRRALRSIGVRYRLQLRTPGGKADLVVPSRKFALFIDGCFWHGCPEHYVHPRTRWPFWDAKLRENVDRDRRQTLALQAQGWRFVRVWEHEVREDPQAVVAQIRRSLESALPPAPPAQWRVVFVRPTSEGATTEERVHEDLLDSERKMTTVRERTTAKTGRVSRGAVSHMSDPASRKRRGGQQHERRPANG